MTKARELADVIGTQSTTENVLQGRRNLIINGDFQVSQRGDFTSGYTSGGLVYLVDRWNFNHVTTPTTDTHKLDQVVNGKTTNTMRVEGGSAGNKTAMAQQIEDYKIFRGQQATVSFWYKSNTTTEWNWWDGITQTHYTLPNTSDVWTFYSKVVTVANNNTNARVEFYQSSTVLNAGEYIEVAFVQCELGSVATPFEHRSYGEELALCQRYYNRIGGESKISGIGSGVTISTTSGWAVINYPVTMRTSPTVSLSGAITLSNGTAYPTTPTLGTVYSNTDAAMVNISYSGGVYSGGGQGAVLYTQNGSDDYVSFDAEL